jgi:hypothetical protein
VAQVDEKKNAYTVLKGKSKENRSRKRRWNRWVNIKMAL